VSPPSGRRIAVAAALDVAAVVVFVILGRRSHHEDGSWLAGTWRVAAPFLIGLAVGWLIARAWRAPQALVTGVVVWLATVAVGMVLRHTVFDRGTAVAFVIVALITLALLLLGWRAIAARASRRLSSRIPAAEATRTTR
jgi:peptidoglycan/LPS O-acetylase OafA/YrhL